nr:putative mitochondrial protein [Tanacetum cinerariifolium]
MVYGCEWTIQGQQFKVDVMLLPLGGCEMTNPEPNTPYNPELRNLLQEFGNVFAMPTELPPQRSCDHRIPLKDASAMINIRPYRYHSNQKDVIEQMLTIETDASGYGIGAVLQQRGHQILSRTLAPKHHSLSAYEKKLLVVGMRKMVNEMVRTCNVCQRNRDDLSSYPAQDIYSLSPIDRWLNRSSQQVFGVLSQMYDWRKPKGLDLRLHLAEYWYNTNYHIAIKTTPFEVVYGQPPALHIPYVAKDSRVKLVDRTLQAREKTTHMLHFNLKKAHDRMKSQADKHRTEREEVDEYYAYFTSSISNKDWNEWYHSGLFVFGLQSKIRKSVEMFNPKSLLDAYHLAKWQESMNDIMRKNSNTSLSSSSKIDHSKEVKEYYIELEFRGDGKGNEAQSSGEEINKFGVKVLKVPYEETVEGIGMKSKGSVELDGKNMEMDGKCLKDIDDFVNKEDKIEENKNEIGIKSRELVDKNMNKVSLDISKDADTGETFSNDIKIDSNDWVACDSNCEESEIFIASNELESHTLVELSKEGNKDDKSALIHVSEDKDYGLVGKFSSDLGVKFDCVGSIFVEASPVVEKPKASVTNIEKDTTYDMLVKGNQEKEKIGSKPDKNGKRSEAGKSQKQLQ